MIVSDELKKSFDEMMTPLIAPDNLNTVAMFVNCAYLKGLNEARDKANKEIETLQERLIKAESGIEQIHARIPTLTEAVEE